MKKNYRKLNPIVKILLSAFVLIGLLTACSNDDDSSEVNFDIEEIVLDPEGGATNLLIHSTTNWNLTTTADWLTFNVTQGRMRTSVTVSYKEYKDSDVIREAEVLATTADGKARATIKLKQMPSSYILLEPDEIMVEWSGGAKSVNITSNLSNLSTDVFDISINYADDQNKGWLKNVAIKEKKLTFIVEENKSSTNRSGLLSISYTDKYNRIIDAFVKISQYMERDPSSSVEETFENIRILPLGNVSKNIYIQGVIVVDGSNDNFNKNRYTIQDVATNKAIVFETETTLGLQRNDYVKLWLMGANYEKVTQDELEYNLFTGIESEAILEKNTSKSLNLPEIYIEDLNDDLLFSLVTLKDVEIAIPFGGLSNYNEYYVTGGGKDYPNLTRNYPITIRDIKGSSLYMITNLEVPYRRESLPQGSGKLTGVVVREQNSNFGGALGEYSIRHLQLSDIDLAKERSNGFSNILVEWNFTMPNGMANGTPHLPPSIGPKDAIFTKSDIDGFNQAWPGRDVLRAYFGEEYRGDFSASGTANAIKLDAVFAAYWDVDTWWIIKNISTKGITKPLSIQFEANSLYPRGPRDFIIEWSLDENSWTPVEGGTYQCIGQAFSTARFTNTIPGYKNYNFNLPTELLGQDNIFIRLRNNSTVAVDGVATVEDVATNRIAHFSIKYNK